jgi:hypothetical protein
VGLEEFDMSRITKVAPFDFMERARLCREKGLGPTDEDRREQREKEERDERDKRVRRLTNARGCLPDNPRQRAALLGVLASDGISGAVSDNPGSVEAFRACRLIESKEEWLVALIGPTGAGKTWASYWLAGVTSSSLLVWASDVQVGSEWDALRTQALSPRCGVLVINDLTARALKVAWRAEQIAEVIEKRHDVGARTLITTNLTSGQSIEAALGDRVASRLAEGVTIECVGDDLRRRRG